MRLILIILCFSLLPSMTWSQESLQSLRSKLMSRIDERQKTGNVTDFFEGTVGRISDSESVWVHLDDERLFRKWAYKVSKSNLDVERQEIRVWLRYVSPKRSISRGKTYNDWFKKKAAFEMGKEFRGRRVRVDYNLLSRVHRVEGVLWTGDNNLNVWLVKNGYSFYLINKGTSKYHQDFLEAEAWARERQLGLWKPAKKK